MKHFQTKSSSRVFTLMAALVAVAFLVQPVATMAQDYEYEPGEGLHEEEWYDPSDWFDVDDDIDYEYDWYDYTYNYPYVYDYDDDYGYWDPYEDEWEYGDDDFVWDDDWEYDYYTEEWWEDEPDFDVWYD